MFRALLAVLCLLVPQYASAQGVFTIRDYPRYGTALDATQREQLRHFATAIVGAVVAGREVNVSIFGHADFDAKGRDFEMKVSKERADAAETELRSLLTDEANKAALPAARLLSVHLVATGNGTLNPVFTNPSGKDEQKQRRANRRVEFVWSVAIAPTPVKPAAFERCQKTIASGAAAGPTRRLSCACGKLQQLGWRAGDFTYDFRGSRVIPGSGGLPRNLTPEQWEAAMRALIIHIRPQIQKASNSSTSDADFRDALLAIDDTIGRNINDFEMQAAAGKGQGVFDRIVLAAIQSSMADPNHIYACYAGYSRQNHNQ